MPLVYRPEEAAEVLRVSTRTVNRLITEGELVAFRVFKDRRIARDDLVEFVERRRTAAGQSTPPPKRGKPRMNIVESA